MELRSGTTIGDSRAAPGVNQRVEKPSFPFMVGWISPRAITFPRGFTKMLTNAPGEKNTRRGYQNFRGARFRVFWFCDQAGCQSASNRAFTASYSITAGVAPYFAVLTGTERMCSTTRHTISAARSISSSVLNLLKLKRKLPVRVFGRTPIALRT